MSTHSNQARKAPTSARKAIRGNSPTYKASVQKAGHASMKGSGHYKPSK